MAKNVLCLFDTMQDAQHVAQALIDLGILREDIGLVVNASEDVSGDAGTTGDTTGGLALPTAADRLTLLGIGPALVAGSLLSALKNGDQGDAGDLVDSLVDMGIPEEDAGYFAEGVRRGGTLVVARTPDDLAVSAAESMQRYNVVDIDERVSQWHQEGWTRFNPDAASFEQEVSDTSPAVPRITIELGGSTAQDRDAKSEIVVPLGEPALPEDARVVQRKGVRTSTYIIRVPSGSDQPEQRITIAPPVVEQPDSGIVPPIAAESTVEITVKDAQVVVVEQERVVEEVIVNDQVLERVETVRHRMHHVDIDNVETSNAPDAPAADQPSREPDDPPRPAQQ